MSGKNIVMLATAVHHAFDTRIFQKEAKSLAKAGFNVSIVIPHEKDEVVDGIKFVSVRKPRSGFQQLAVTPLKIFMKALSFPRKSVFHIHDSELLMIGVLLKLLGRRVLYDAHEDTPRQLHYQHWIPNLVKPFYIAFYFLLERFCGIIFDAIIIAEPVIGRHYPKRKTTLVRNFVITENLKERDWVETADLNQVIYIGLLSKPRGLIEMIEAIDLVPKEINVKLILGGRFAPPTLYESIKNSERVEFVGWVPSDQIQDHLAKASIGIITPHPNKRYISNYPVKLFEYMAAGLPVIASKFGESAKFVEEADCGILVDPLNPASISKTIEFLLSHPKNSLEMGDRGKKLIQEKYNWEIEGKRLVELYNKLIS